MKSLFIKCTGLLLTAGCLLLAACGAGPNETANLAKPPGAVTPTTTTVTAVVTPQRVVAGRIYTYQADATPGTTVTWAWGDGSPESVGSTVQKVWNRAGDQTITLSAIASGNPTPTFVTQTVAVTGEPVSSGANHTCALQPAGTVLCWGDNSSRQLGGGLNVPVSTTATVAVTGLTNAVALSAGENHTCALKVGGSVACWGNNVNGQLGDGTNGDAIATPTAVRGLTTAVAITAGQFHTCALKSDASAVCWGYNALGQLGNGSFDGDGSTPVTTPAPVTGLTDAVAISAGSNHTCALKTDGSMVCWGVNGGRLGNGTNGDNQSRPVAVQGLAEAVALSAGNGHTCALKSNGSASCWGTNNSGQIGDGTTTTRVVSTAVAGLTDAIAINAGGNNDNIRGSKGRTCVIKANGSTVCWGDKGYAVNGNGVVVQTIPTAVPGLTDTAAISMGGDHTCALKASGAVVCWGNNTNGQIGDGTAGSVQTSLVQVTTAGGALTDTTSVSVGNLHTCVRKTDGTVLCWGSATYGQLGQGAVGGATPIPISVDPVFDLTNTAEVTAGGDHTCARKTDGTVACWGRNNEGQLGNGTTTDSSRPVVVSGLADIAAVSASGNYTCAVKNDKTVVCWGRNNEGQLGNGTIADSSTPVVVNGLTDAAVISGSSGHTCAIKNDKTVVCWGYNVSGELGNGTTISSPTPVVVSGLIDVAEVSAGENYTCAVKIDKTVVCWGRNNYGQLGSGTTTDSLTPVVVSGLADVTAVSAGDVHTCATKNDKTVVCWGRNDNANGANLLGNGIGTNSTTFVVVSGLTDVAAISAGTLHTCATKNDTTVVCWGNNNTRQLGGTIIIATSINLNPTPVAGGSIFWR